MEKIYISYSGSMVNTTAVLAYLFLAGGIIGSLIILKDIENLHFALGLFITCLVTFVFLLVVSASLEHLLYIRKIMEAKAEADGFEIKKETSN